LQDVYQASTQEGPELLKRWCQRATRSRLAPLKKLAQTFRQYWAGIVVYFQCRIPQGTIEAINGIIQLAKRRARGFRNFLYLGTIAYRVTGRRKGNLPPIFTQLKQRGGKIVDCPLFLIFRPNNG
jgi:transposase